MEGGRSVDRTVSWFTRYTECASESHNEKIFCEYMGQELAEMGIPFERQELDNEAVIDGWGILARIPDKSDKTSLLFMLHLDTAAPSNQVEVCVEGRCIRSKGNSVLGTDGKLAIAAVMEAVERLTQEREIDRPIKLLFIVCQELGLREAKYAGYSRIESGETIVIDHYVTGKILTRTPTKLYMNVELIGCAVHVIRNEEPGASALLTAVEIIHQIPTGRLNDNLSINAFDLVSLSPSDAVPRYVQFDVEVRCFGNDTKQKVRDRIHHGAEEAAGRMGCKCNIRGEEDVPETDFSENTDMLERLASTYSRSGLSVIPARPFGVLDVTYTNQLGIRAVPIGFNIYHSHSAREYVVIEDVKKMLELAENTIRYL